MVDPTLTMSTNEVENPSVPPVITHQDMVLEADSHDEGYEETDSSSLLSSMAEEYKFGKVENGRMYPSYGKHEYGLPIDDDELDRLDLNHTKYSILQNDKIYMAPIPADLQNVLDVGTGTGIWSIDFADHHPSASVIGVDIAPVQPTWVPPNCQFQVDDVEEDWTFKTDFFDYIHVRDLYHAVRNWPKLVQQCYDHTKPGGWCEFAQTHPTPMSDDNTLDSSAGYCEIAQAWNDIGQIINCEPDSAKKFKQWFVEAGFENVEEYVFKVPCSPWPKDPRMKKVGAFEMMNVLTGARGFMLRGWTKDFGMTLEELEMTIHRMSKELPTNKMHVYITFYVVIGRKPRSKFADEDE